jgi:hypothetical protein
MYEKLSFDSKLRERIDLLCHGEFELGRSGRLQPRKVSGARNLPWIFINHDARKKFCWFWNGVCCKLFKIIPTHCRFGCWKIVIKPRNVAETFDCYNRMVAVNLPSKIGMDLRHYTHAAWGGYVYTDTIEEGREHYKIIRKAIPKAIPVTLKRGCTEMEKLQSSDLWDDVPESHLATERRLHDLFHFQERSFKQSAWHKQEIKERWVKHAIMIADPTAKETAEKYSGDPDIWKKLVVESVTYHEEKK